MSTTLYFLRNKSLKGYESVSHDDSHLPLSYIIGDTLAHLFCECESPLECVRMYRATIAETIVVRKRIDDIKVTIYTKDDKTPIRRADRAQDPFTY